MTQYKLEDDIGSLSQSILDLEQDKKKYTNLSNVNNIDIYRRNYYLSVYEVFADNFPKSLSFIGKKNLQTIAYDYLKIYPSSKDSLDEIIGDFDSYLEIKKQVKIERSIYWIFKLEYVLNYSFVKLPLEINMPENLVALYFEAKSEKDLSKMSKNTVKIKFSLDNKKNISVSL